MYDVAIIGSGPAGISAALNLKLHNKEIVWFGAKELSLKVEKSEKIANYPGLALISGEDLNHEFKHQIEEAGLEITEKMVTNIMPSNGGFMILGDNDVYEAESVLLATGTVGAKALPGEEEFLGRGVSYCATCDGFLYKNKTIAVLCGAKRYEHEVSYLAEMAQKVYLLAPYQGCEINLPNVEILQQPIKAVCGEDHVNAVELQDGQLLDIDGFFILRTAVAASNILKGLEMDGPHIVVGRSMETSKSGVFAAGDCTGRPYQIAKAVGEGNIAAHSILDYLSKKA